MEQILPGNYYYKLKNYERQINCYNVDFYDKKNKIVIEYNGDFWHAREGKYKDDYIIYGRTAAEIREHDKNRLNKVLQSEKVNDIIIVWDSDYRTNPTATVEKLKTLIGELNETRESCNHKRIRELV